MLKKYILFLGFILFSTNLFAAQTQIAQVNGMMCIKCQKMVTKALQAASPSATVKVSWPEGVAVSSYPDKSDLSNEGYKKAQNFMKLMMPSHVKKIKKYRGHH